MLRWTAVPMPSNIRVPPKVIIFEWVFEMPHEGKRIPCYFYVYAYKNMDGILFYAPERNKNKVAIKRGQFVRKLKAAHEKPASEAKQVGSPEPLPLERWYPLMEWLDKWKRLLKQTYGSETIERYGKW